MSSEDHRLLLDRVLAGRQALQALWLALVPVVKGVVRHYLRSNDHVDDLAQEVFLKFSAEIESYRGEGELRAWIAMITRRICFDHFRKNGRSIPTAPWDEQICVAVEDPAWNDEIARQLIEVDEVLSTMTPREQRVVKAKLDGWEKDAEVAERLGMTYDQVRAIIKSLRRKMGRGTGNTNAAKVG